MYIVLANKIFIETKLVQSGDQQRKTVKKDKKSIWFINSRILPKLVLKCDSPSSFS